MADIKEKLLGWVQKRCAPFNVQVDNFTSAFSDGRAFCALTSSIDAGFKFKEKTELVDARQRLDSSFHFNEDHLQIPRLLNAEHLLPPFVVDEKSVITYISLVYQEHGRTKAIKPEPEPEPEPEVQGISEDVHFEFSGSGHLEAISNIANTFSVAVTDRNTGAPFPNAPELLNVTIVKASGQSLPVTKTVDENLEIKFEYNPPTPEPFNLRIEYDNFEVATIAITPAPFALVEWDDWIDVGGQYPVGNEAPISA